MKPLLTALTALSLIANLALVGLLLAGRSSDASGTAAPTAAAASAKSAAEPAPGADAWESMAKQESPALVQHLREAGFPPHIVRAILTARLQESFAPRIKALRPDAVTAPFWKNYSVDPRIRQAEFAVYREQQKALRDLLGADAEAPEMSIYNHRRYDTVPAAKVQDVKDALRQFEDRRQEVYSTAVGMISNDQQRRVQELEKEYQANLASILSPEELHEFNLRNSDTARSLRMELAAFNPTEQEFRDIYKLRSTLEPYLPNMSQEEMQRRGEAQNRVQEQIKSMLGSARATEFQRSTDFAYRQASQLVSRLELPPETTNKMWDVRDDINQRAMSLRRDSSLSPADRAKQLNALADEAGQRVSTLLGGQRGLDAFKQNGGYWIDALRARGPTSGTISTGVIIRGP